MRVLLLKRKKKKDNRSPHFWALHFGLYSLLFVCFNKHTRTRVQKLQIVSQIHVSANSLFKFSSNLRLHVEEGGLKVCHCWPYATVSPCMPSSSKSPSVVGISELCLCSGVPHVPKHLTNWCPKFTVNAATSERPGGGHKSTIGL